MTYFVPGRELTKDPYLSFKFKVEIGDTQGEKGGIKDDKKSIKVGFNEVTGLTFETEVETFREGGINDHVRQLAGPSKCSDKLLLKRGLAGRELWNWYRQIMSGQVVRKKLMIITLLDSSGGDTDWQWVFRDVCPVKWTGPQLRAGTAEVAFDTIEIIHKGLL